MRASYDLAVARRLQAVPQWGITVRSAVRRTDEGEPAVNNTLYIILIVLLVLAVLGYFGRGRFGR